MKKIALAVLTAVVFSNAQQAAAENKRTVDIVMDDVKMLARKVAWMKDSLHTLHVKLDSLASQNREILELLKNPKIKIKIH